MPDDWDSSPVWAQARERARAEVHAAFAPKPQTCPVCGRVESTASRYCPGCGASYVMVQPKLSRRAKLLIVAAAVVLAAAGGVTWALVSPSINHAKRVAAERAAAEQAAFVRSERRRLRLDERLRRGRGGPASRTPSALVLDLQNAITADARARVKSGSLSGPIQGTSCTAVSVGPLVPNARRGGYECVAINANIPKEGRGVTGTGGLLGYPFWAIVDYRHRTFAWCKVNPKPGEQAVQAVEPVVPPPAACDLHI